MPQPAVVLCGPSGVTHAPPERTNRSRVHPIESLARQFGCVEISSSFSEFLRPEQTGVWVHKVETNPAFQFTVKLHRRFSHERSMDSGEIARFKEGLWPLYRARRLGCLLMQFPWSFRYTAENRDHLIRLRRAFREFPVVAEMRHISWSFDEAVGTFIDHRIGFCNIDQPSYTKAMPPTSFLTSATGYVRLHGRNCFNWFGAADHPSRKPRYDYLYSRTELEEWSRRVDQVRGYAARTFVVLNNGTDGKAIANALEMQEILDGRPAADAGARRRAAQAALFTEFHGRAVA